MIARTARTGAAGALTCALVGLFCACHRPVPGPAPAPSESAPPLTSADRLAPGELLEGSDRAFGLTLPRGLRIEESFAAVVFARGPLKATDVANYVRSRVSGGSVTVGAAATVFNGVFAATDPTRPLTIHVEALPRGDGARVEVRDATPPPGMPGSTDEEKWKAAGLAPNGKIADPTHLH
jgi:hypothetical protein